MTLPQLTALHEMHVAKIGVVIHTHGIFVSFLVRNPAICAMRPGVEGHHDVHRYAVTWFENRSCSWTDLLALLILGRRFPPCSTDWDRTLG
jgi:hypothetical protein